MILRASKILAVLGIFIMAALAQMFVFSAAHWEIWGWSRALRLASFINECFYGFSFRFLQKHFQFASFELGSWQGLAVAVPGLFAYALLFIGLRLGIAKLGLNRRGWPTWAPWLWAVMANLFLSQIEVMLSFGPALRRWSERNLILLSTFGFVSMEAVTTLRYAEFLEVSYWSLPFLALVAMGQALALVHLLGLFSADGDQTRQDLTVRQSLQWALTIAFLTWAGVALLPRFILSGLSLLDGVLNFAGAANFCEPYGSNVGTWLSQFAKALFPGFGPIESCLYFESYRIHEAVVFDSMSALKLDRTSLLRLGYSVSSFTNLTALGLQFGALLGILGVSRWRRVMKILMRSFGLALILRMTFLFSVLLYFRN